MLIIFPLRSQIWLVGKIMKKNYYVYILASRKSGTLYTGISRNLKKRVFEHKNNLFKGFTEKYKVKKLVYFETHNRIDIAILREKRIKKWNRSWKIELIESMNPDWKDLYYEIPNF
jgi:putative endonuclease